MTLRLGGLPAAFFAALEVEARGENELQVEAEWRGALAELVVRLANAGIVAPTSAYAGLPGPCAVCGASLAGADWFVDGEVLGADAWGLMCAKCFDGDGAGLGWGVGQLFIQRRFRGQLCFVCIAGSHPDPGAGTR